MKLLCITPPYPIDGAWLTVRVTLVAVDRAEWARCPSGSCSFQYRSDRIPQVQRLTRFVGSNELLSFEGFLRAVDGVRSRSCVPSNRFSCI